MLALAPAVLASCDSEAVYDRYLTIPHEGWHKDSVAVFSVPAPDTVSAYNLYINLRNTGDYPFQNLFLFVTILAPNGASVRDTLELYLADDHGQWLGRGRGNVHDSRFPYRQSVKFSSPGSYRIELQQAMRTDNLTGVANVGVRVEHGEKAR